MGRRTVKLWEPEDLAEQFGVTLRALPAQPAVETAPSGPMNCPKFSIPPRVAEALENRTGDRSVDQMRVAAACLDAGLRLDETRLVIHSRADLAERLNGRTDDDVLNCWIKLIDSRQTTTIGIYSQSEVDGDEAAEPTTWEAQDLNIYLSGNYEPPKTEVGLSRHPDGIKLIYPGREHAVFGETECGKSWLALGCAATELRMGRKVLYIHYEESDAASTVERLLLLDVPPLAIKQHLTFVAPAKPLAKADWLAVHLDPSPVLVIHDGVNEAMTLQGDDIMGVEGWATFRRTVIKPCLTVGAATLVLDHVTKSAEGRGRYSIGTVHKVNALDGAAFSVKNVEPFGRGRRGASHVFIAKDRPGQLRHHGKPTKGSSETYFGTLIVDDNLAERANFSLILAAAKDCEDDAGADQTASDPESAAIEAVYTVIASHGSLGSRRVVAAAVREAGHRMGDKAIHEALERLLIQKRIQKLEGSRGAWGYRVVATDAGTQSPTIDATTDAATDAATDAPIESASVGISHQSAIPTAASINPHQSASVEPRSRRSQANRENKG